jgi:hypothetical protein
MASSYNHTREDSPLMPCPACAHTDAERELTEALAHVREELENAKQNCARLVLERTELVQALRVIAMGCTGNCVETAKYALRRVGVDCDE